MGATLGRTLGTSLGTTVGGAQHTARSLVDRSRPTNPAWAVDWFGSMKSSGLLGWPRLHHHVAGLLLVSVTRV